MDFSQRDGVVYKHVPAGGQGGGVTGLFPVKASKAEAAAFLAPTIEEQLATALSEIEKLKRLIKAAENIVEAN